MSNQMVTPTDSELEGKYLTFALSEEHYGVHILKVQEIIGVMHITRVPASPQYLKGVINLRGKIIPVVDLREKFNLETVPYDDKTCIIVVDVMLADKRINIGVIVDTVVEVVHFTSDDLETAPDFGHTLSANFIQGMGRAAENRVVILIDIDKVLADTPAAKFIQSQIENESTAGH
jgi:purine-binding chemotaxis protein CheW